MTKMGRPAEVVLLLALFVLLGTMHGTRAKDLDQDGIPDSEDDDDDNDGVPDSLDYDDDNDGIPDILDCDVDGDGIPDSEDNDLDNDGVPDSVDCDVDGDGIPDSKDNDLDNDGVPDWEDADVDNDGIADSEDDDNDNDGIPDSVDCDDDNDGVPDAVDDDDDNDGVPDSEDDGDDEDFDDDGDGTPDYLPDDYDYENYEDYDDEDYYDEEDLEGEGYEGAYSYAGAVGNRPSGSDLDFDSDGILDYLDTDDDNDGIPDDEDLDDDNDGIDDDEDTDDDNDGIPDELEGKSEVEGGRAPTGSPQNQEFTPMCNNENCWIRVDWEPPARDTWMSCLLGYKVWFRTSGREWDYERGTMNDEGTHRDLRSGRTFFFEEAEGTNHSLTIRNLDFETFYEIFIEVNNPYGGTQRSGYEVANGVATPPGLCTNVSLHLSFQCKSRRALPRSICS